MTLAEPTRAIRTEAVAAGFYQTPMGGKIPKIQILTSYRGCWSRAGSRDPTARVRKAPRRHQPRAAVKLI